MNVIGFFLLWGIAIAMRFLGQKLIPVAVPRGRLKVVAVGWLGGLLASLLEGFIGPWEPKLGGIYIMAAIAGAALSIYGWGLAPFVRIMLGRQQKGKNKPIARWKGEKR